MRRASRRLCSSLALSSLVAVATIGAPAPAAGQTGMKSLERCRAAEQDFDYETAVSECGAAAAEPGLTPAQLLEVYGLMGISHTALRDDAKAETWFLKLLVLDPDHTFPPEVSPVYREALEKARTRFNEEGKVAVASHVAPTIAPTATGPFPVRFELTDRLGRIQSAAVVVRAENDVGSLASLDVALRRVDSEQPGTVAFAGEIPDPATVSGTGANAPYRLVYTLSLTSVGGEPLPLDPPFEPATYPRESSGASEAEGDGGGLLWAIVGGGAAGGAAVIGVVGVAVGVGVACALGYCSEGEPPPEPVGFVVVGPEN